MRVLLTAGMALYVLAGCGGGGDERLSDADFRAQANAVCVAYSEKVNSLPDPGGYADLAQYAASAHTALVTALGRLKALHPPNTLDSDYKAWLASNDRSL